MVFTTYQYIVWTKGEVDSDQSSQVEGIERQEDELDSADTEESEEEIESEGKLSPIISLPLSDFKAWKPSIQYFDYYVQSTEEEVVRQVFPYVKVLYSHPSLVS